MRLGMAVLRLVLGGLLIGHGLQKLRGWFSGPGPEGTGAFFEKLGLRPGKPHAVAAGLSETAGGALLAAGLLTPLGAAMVTGSMVVAIDRVHWPKGVWASEGGYEYNLVIIAAAFAVVAAGPGEWSLDEQLGLELDGAVPALAALAAGVGGAAAVSARARRQQAVAVERKP